MLQVLAEWFWWERLWFPANVTWSDFDDDKGHTYAKVSHLYVTLPYAVVFMVLRYFFEQYVAAPLGKAVGIKDAVRRKAADNPLLERYYSSRSKMPSQSDIEGLSKKSSCTVRQVERWFRRRRNQDRPGLLKKFKEACWRFAFYLLAFVGGIVALYDKPWFYDTDEVWKHYPLQSMMPSQYWYYVIEMSFYWSLCFSIAFDVKRKDFKEQIIHHLATIILLSFSWCANYARIGTLVMITHDASDILLESAKLFHYAGWKDICDAIFVCFAVVFIVTRLVIFPFWLIHCTWFGPLKYYPPFFGYYFFNLMLLVLQCLHIYWAFLILRMVQKFISGNLEKDERSDEEEDDDDTTDEDEHQHKVNGLINKECATASGPCDH
ncbi:ceramide synthase 2 [Polypterus senegalus]|uniref:ceramide synthase 2 n=1 Tax=Polypterus senegalus TaxID=55291 RepID=UPI0019651936|nr:ceramide synthase 2 [Polypterus senegalus]XP_039628653.1 ceramide synthase 2 [Polypterus senegalus]